MAGPLDPEFTGVKQPAFDTLVDSHDRAAGQLDQLATDLWRQLVRLNVDASPALRIRALARRMAEQVVDLRARQAQIHAIQKRLRVPPSGTYWPLPPGPPAESPEKPEFPDTQPYLAAELSDAANLSYPTVDPHGLRFSDKEEMALSWIELHREAILREARRWHIPPAAIASAIAWEAVENVQGVFGPFARRFGRDGPGKFDPHKPLGRQVEDLGYLPKVSEGERTRIVQTDEGAIKYIAAAMAAFADVTERDGRFPSIRNNIVILTHLYNEEDVEEWQHLLAKKPPGEPFAADDSRDFRHPWRFGESKMSAWVRDHPEFVAAIDEALRGSGVPLNRPPGNRSIGPRWN